MPIEGMMFVLSTFESNLRLNALEEEVVAPRDATEYSDYLSAKRGERVEYLRYEGTPDHKKMVEAIAQEATAGIWTFEGDSESSNDDDVEEVLEGDPTPVMFFESNIAFPMTDHDWLDESN
jgi:hypothetical protein